MKYIAHAATEDGRKDPFLFYSPTPQAAGRCGFFLSPVRNAWARLLGFGVRFFMLCVFVTPDDVVQRLPDEV